MPYTPPSLRSPAVSQNTSPVQTPRRPQLPRSNSSTSYLSRHRRGLSLPDYTPDHVQPTMNGHTGKQHSIRPSPQPIRDGSMPAGAITTPPDSAHASDDDESGQRGGRGVEKFGELHDAVHRSFDASNHTGSPENEPARTSQNQPKLHLDLPARDFEHPSPNEEAPPPTPPKLSSAARKISHSRSATEDSFFELQHIPSEGGTPAASDDSDEDFEHGKPPLLRKKSGELVKPAIRPVARRKHSSMPGTPTYSKAVRFNENIEQVKHFLMVDRPIAVSAGASPADGHDEETEFPFGFKASREVEWELRLKNFPRESLERMTKPVRVERLYLTPDQKSLVGVVAVANLSFHKQVTARFTLDYWRTTSEVVGEYNNDLRQRPRDDGYDQFNFSIKLSDQAHLEIRTLLLCIRYNVGGQEYWDNNDDMNFAVEFVKKEKPTTIHHHNPAPTASAPIPRSRHNSSASTGRPRSIPSFEDDFSSGFDTDSRIKFRNAGGRKDSLANARQNPPGSSQFSTRYDFGASLSAALSQAQAQSQMRDRDSKKAQSASHASDQAEKTEASRTSTLPARTGVVAPASSQVQTPRHDNLIATKQAIDSRAYQEFISKFCFVGAKQGAEPAGAVPVAAPVIAQQD